MTATATPTEVMEAVWATFAEGRRTEIPDLFFAPDASIKVQGAPHVPFVGEFRGREAQRSFFELGGAEAQRFEIKRVIAQGEDVITLGEFEFLVTATGRRYSGDWALHTRVVDGQIVWWQMFEDAWTVGKAFDG